MNIAGPEYSRPDGLIRLPETALLRRGDTLVIRYDQGTRITDQAVAQIRERARAACPELKVLVVVADEIAVRRPWWRGKRRAMP